MPAPSLSSTASNETRFGPMSGYPGWRKEMVRCCCCVAEVVASGRGGGRGDRNLVVVVESIVGGCWKAIVNM